MKIVKANKSCSWTQRGQSLMQLVVALGLGGVLMAGVISEWVSTTARAKDLRKRSLLRQELQHALELMRFELSLVGTAVPISIASSASLGDQGAPIATDSTDIDVTFLANIDGSSTLTSSDYTASSSSIAVVDGSIFVAGDTIVLTDDRRSTSETMLAQVSSVLSNTLSISNIQISTPGAVFPAGSTVEAAKSITYSLGPGNNGIERTVNGTSTTLLRNGSFQLNFYDRNGGTLSPPLSLVEQRTDFASIQVEVTATTADLSEQEVGYARVGLRSLNSQRD